LGALAAPGAEAVERTEGLDEEAVVERIEGLEEGNTGAEAAFVSGGYEWEVNSSATLLDHTDYNLRWEQYAGHCSLGEFCNPSPHRIPWTAA